MLAWQRKYWNSPLFAKPEAGIIYSIIANLFNNESAAHEQLYGLYLYFGGRVEDLCEEATLDFCKSTAEIHYLFWV